MAELFFLKPIFKERVWGGRKLESVFNYQIPDGNIGECWAISAHQNGPCQVLNGTYMGTTLAELWLMHPELFNSPSTHRFPLLTKILDAQETLAIQVHPDDLYSLSHENDLGKTECWYILEAEPDTEIILGHNASSKEELRNMIDLKEWKKLLIRVPVKKGDFIYVPSGTIHALGKGALVLEIQQSSDVTYRLDDFGRIHSNGKKIALDIEETIAVTTIPHNNTQNKIKKRNLENATITTFVENQFFSVFKWDIKATLHLSKTKAYTLCSVISGHGTIQIQPSDEKYDLQMGDHFVIPTDVNSWIITGEVVLIVTSPPIEDS